jgi:hypothetical protein
LDVTNGSSAWDSRGPSHVDACVQVPRGHTKALDVLAGSAVIDYNRNTCDSTAATLYTRSQLPGERFLDLRQHTKFKEVIARNESSRYQLGSSGSTPEDSSPKVQDDAWSRGSSCTHSSWTSFRGTTSRRAPRDTAEPRRSSSRLLGSGLASWLGGRDKAGISRAADCRCVLNSPFLENPVSTVRCN